MAALDAAIQKEARFQSVSWMTASSAAMTAEGVATVKVSQPQWV
jgi:hypothetical protein